LTELRDRILGGAFWVGASQVLVQGVRFVGLLVLVRILSPGDFGLVAMCFVVTGVTVIFIEMGLPNALIQARELTPLQRSSAAWVFLALAAAVATITVLAAPLLGALFREPRVVALLRVFSAGFVINALAVVPDSVLRRKMKFREVGVADAVHAFSYVAVAVPLALSGFGPWSLVGGELGGAVGRVVVLTWLSRERPFGRFDASSLRPLFSFGAKNAASNLCHAVRFQADTFIVGRALGAGLLGGYNITKRLITAPQQRVSWILSKVCFPGFSRIQDDDERLRRAYIKIISVTAFITWPALAFVAGNPGPVVEVFFGSQWLFIVTPLRLMCIAGAAVAVITLNGPVVLAKGRAGLELKLSMFSLPLIIAGMFIGVRYGLVGVGIGFAAYVLIAGGLSQYFTNRIIGLRLRQYVKSVMPAVFTSVSVGVCTSLTGWVLHSRYGTLASVAGSVFVSTLVYAIFAFAYRRAEIITAVSFVRERARLTLARYGYQGDRIISQAKGRI
jgi:PST family polysaccharide transporter